MILRAIQRKEDPKYITVLRPCADIYFTSLGKAKYDEPVHKDDIPHCLPISLDHDLSTSEEETRLVMEEQGLATTDELVSGQKILLEYGIIWPDMTWCGNNVPNMNLK